MCPRCVPDVSEMCPRRVSPLRSSSLPAVSLPPLRPPDCTAPLVSSAVTCLRPLALLFLGPFCSPACCLPSCPLLLFACAASLPLSTLLAALPLPFVFPPCCRYLPGLLSLLSPSMLTFSLQARLISHCDSNRLPTSSPALKPCRYLWPVSFLSRNLGRTSLSYMGLCICRRLEFYFLLRFFVYISNILPGVAPHVQQVHARPEWLLV